jgi:hypothetical protein
MLFLKVLLLFKAAAMTDSFSIQPSANNIAHKNIMIQTNSQQQQQQQPFNSHSLSHSCSNNNNNNNNNHHNCRKRLSLHPLFSSNKEESESESLPTYGGLIGTITGLSMTAIRQSVRTTTGLSLTASRTALRGLTGVSVTATMKLLFGIFPPWVSFVVVC